LIKIRTCHHLMDIQFTQLITSAIRNQWQN